MFYRKDGNVITVRPEVGENIPDVLISICEKENVFFGYVNGIGATKKATVGCYIPAAGKYIPKTFEEPMEIVSLLGNISKKDGKPYVHLHASFSGKDCNVVGGHLLEAIIGITGEIFITVVDGELERVINPENGLTILNI